jgi:methyl-accepting chemotaxis protein
MFFKNQKGSLRNKLALRFGILLVIFTLAMGVTFIILNNSININNRIFTIYNPSIKKLENYRQSIINSQTLINSWVATQSDNNHPDKVKLRDIIKSEVPKSKKEIEAALVDWEPSEREKFVKVSKGIDSLYMSYGTVMTKLSSFDSYLDAQVVMFEITPMIQDGGSIVSNYSRVIKGLDEIIDIQNQHAESAGNEMTDYLNVFKGVVLLIVLVTIVIGVVITISTVRIITIPIKKVKEVLVNMGKGVLPDSTLAIGGDEIGEMSSALNHLNEGLRKTAGYADRIGNGDMEATFEPLSEGDVLGNSLLEMGKKLKKLNEEDVKRHWAATGLAEFAQLLRENTDMQLLFDNIISKLVKYVGANQGAMFLVKEGDDENEARLAMASCYAYDRKKFMEKVIEPGEGLIGQCFIEKDIIYLTDVPESYVHITSGLGHSTPRCIALFPLVVNDTIMGVIELASFKVLDTYETDFLKKLCENIAGTISNVKINQRTISLLEHSKISQQNMAEKEEEMKQNLEELTATQEEMNRKENEYIMKINALENRLEEKSTTK